MLEQLTAWEPRVSSPWGRVLDDVAAIATDDLAPLVESIDLDAVYPEAVMRKLGAVGAYGMHLPGYSRPGASLDSAIAAMQTVGQKCLSTAFCMWCQDALGWYIFNSDNIALQNTLGADIAQGRKLGGTGLSNPMKSFFGIEQLRLTGERVAGGYRVKGLLPWVSNLGEDHCFGAIFGVGGPDGRRVMAVIDCANEAVRLSMDSKFVALDGTRTFAIQIRDLFVPDDMILADPIDDYLPKIRAGFVLLQSGMAFGIIQSSIDLMKQMSVTLGHVNKYLDEQPEQFEDHLAEMKAQVRTLCETPHETDPDYWRQVITARLAAGEATVKAAHAAMLHSGARGYVINGEAQRRLREAYFVAIVTPATKQLRKMLADMAH